MMSELHFTLHTLYSRRIISTMSLEGARKCHLATPLSPSLTRYDTNGDETEVDVHFFLSIINTALGQYGTS